MILELVMFKTPAGWDRTHILEDAKHTIPKWVANRDLLRKHFALGVGADEGTIVGMYILSAREGAAIDSNLTRASLISSTVAPLASAAFT